jgi:hypothetical protein
MKKPPLLTFNYGRDTFELAAIIHSSRAPRQLHIRRCNLIGVFRKHCYREHRTAAAGCIAVKADFGILNWALPQI